MVKIEKSTRTNKHCAKTAFKNRAVQPSCLSSTYWECEMSRIDFTVIFKFEKATRNLGTRQWSILTLIELAVGGQRGK